MSEDRIRGSEPTVTLLAQISSQQAGGDRGHMRVTKGKIACLRVDSAMLHRVPSAGETHAPAAGDTGAGDPQSCPWAARPDPERSRIAPGYSHFQEVAEAGIRVCTAFPQSGFGASSSPGRGLCHPCVVAQLLPLSPAFLTSS